MPAGSGRAIFTRAPVRLHSCWLITRAAGLMLILYGVFAPGHQDPALLLAGAALIGLDFVALPNDRSPGGGIGPRTGASESD